ncbi:MAG: hypothetical protein KDA52_10820, partial [Planctomycetaceae bacterium]|nr:hypothetical protein [Planctomycetaceae bacterium]
MPIWEFWVDVGGTFTDCVARSPDGALSTIKTLSSGVTPGCVRQRLDDQQIADPARSDNPSGFWNGYRLRFFRTVDGTGFETSVIDNSEAGILVTSEPLPN